MFNFSEISFREFCEPQSIQRMVTVTAQPVSVVVLSISAQIADLIEKILALNVANGIANSLDSKLQAVMAALDDMNENNDVAAIQGLQAFINAVEAQRGKMIPEIDADLCIAAAEELIAQIEAQ